MPTGIAADGGRMNSSTARPPIETFAIDYDCPCELVNLLVGKTEQETGMNIRMMIRYLESVWYKSRMGEYA